MFLCFDRLMQSVRITASRHDTSCKLINNENLVIFYNIILILEHKIMCPQCKYNIMLDFKVFRVCKVFYMEKLLYFMNTFLCKVYNLVLFIYDEISCFILNNTHERIHL